MIALPKVRRAAHTGNPVCYCCNREEGLVDIVYLGETYKVCQHHKKVMLDQLYEEHE